MSGTIHTYFGVNALARLKQLAKLRNCSVPIMVKVLVEEGLDRYCGEFSVDEILLEHLRRTGPKPWEAIKLSLDIGPRLLQGALRKLEEEGKVRSRMVGEGTLTNPFLTAWEIIVRKPPAQVDPFVADIEADYAAEHHDKPDEGAK